MKEHMADWRIHALAFVLTVIAEFIGTQKFSFGPLSFSLFPMLYVLILGAILGIVKLIPQKMMTEASPYIGISVMMLTAKIASTIGPNLGAVVKAGPALILQEFGNLGTAVLALPIAIFVFHMGRAAIGTSFSISRESSLAVVADKYGLDSDEGIGVMGGYITGTVFGTMFNGIFVSLLCSLNIFHLSASLAAVVEAYPDMEAEITAYAATSNMLSSVDGLYMSIFIALPMCEFMYKLFTKNNRHYKDGLPIGAKVKVKAAGEE